MKNTIKITLKCHPADVEDLKKELHDWLMGHRIGIDEIKIE